MSETVTPAEREAAELAVHEKAIVGVILNDPSVADEVISSVDPEMFSCLDARRMFTGVATLHQAGVALADRNTVGAKLLGLGVSPDLCTLSSLHKLKNGSFPTNRRYHIAEVRRGWLKREVAKLGNSLNSRAATTSDPDRELAWAESQLSLLAIGRASALETRRADAIADDVLAELKESAVTKPGVMTGLYELDAHLGPVMPGELIVVAARPGQGKTSLAMQIAQKVAEHGQVLFVSLEMRDRELIRRSLSALAGVESQKLRESKVTTSDFDLLSGARHMLTGLQLEICAPNRATIQQICGVAKYRKAMGGLRMLLVDYIGLIRASSYERGMDRHLQVGEFTAALKALAKELEVPIVALAQLNRDAQNKEPNMANLRESGSIEQDADIVLLIHHPPTEQKAQIIVAKHRHGRQCIIRIKWNPSTTSFGEPRIDNCGGQEWNPN